MSRQIKERDTFTRGSAWGFGRGQSSLASQAPVESPAERGGREGGAGGGEEGNGTAVFSQGFLSARPETGWSTLTRRPGQVNLSKCVLGHAGKPHTFGIGGRAPESARWAESRMALESM